MYVSKKTMIYIYLNNDTHKTKFMCVTKDKGKERSSKIQRYLTNCMYNKQTNMRNEW